MRRTEAGEIGINEAALYYGIPSRLLRRRRQTGIFRAHPLCPQGILGTDNEKRLMKHIKDLERPMITIL
jgi:hypothetical protein